jgi:hypothetical protein
MRFLTEKDQRPDQCDKEGFVGGIEWDIDENRLGFRRRPATWGANGP